MNITFDLINKSRENPKNIALILDNETITYEQLDALAWQSAQLLYNYGVREGDVLGCIFRSETDLAITLLGMMRIGATALPMSRSMTSYQRNSLMTTANAKHLLVDHGENYGMEMPVINFSYSDVVKVNKIKKSILKENPEAPLIITSGSGSTGAPKIISVRHEQMTARTRVIDNLPDDRCTSLVNLHFLGEITRFLGSVYYGNATFFGSLIRGNLIETLRHKSISVLGGTVFHMEKILENITGKVSLDFLRQIRTGGSTITTDLRKRMREKLSHAPYIIYGTNESGYISLCKPEDSLSRENTVGKIVPEMEIRIICGENHAQKKKGVGLIQVKSPGCITEYYKAEGTDSVNKEGWFSPGDIVKIEEDGVLLHLGRGDEMIISNGINIYPAEIENCLSSHPGVADVATLPMASKISQQIPVSFVKIKSGVTATEIELITYANERLGFYSPKYIFIVPEIPRNTRGKVIREDMLKMLRNRLISGPNGVPGL
jgi:acyl-coenzyme A synthetase/AMP-(fatty) acid ligase